MYVDLSLLLASMICDLQLRAFEISFGRKALCLRSIQFERPEQLFSFVLQ